MTASGRSFKLRRIGESRQPTAAVAAAVTWAGHATVLLEFDGVRLLTDPVLGKRVGPLLGPLVGPLIRVAPLIDVAALGRVDCVLLSHLHADHADSSSLRALGPSTPVLAPRGAGRWLLGAGLREVQELGAGDDIAVGALRVRATKATHDRRRLPLGPSATPIGYVVSGSRSAYFAGDTDLFEEMADLRGEIDVALLPVWGWGPDVGEGHLDPQRAARVAEIIAPAIAIPIHWGTYALGPPFRRPSDPERPAREFARFAAEYAPGVDVRVLAVGERLEV
jgi:L-ascorbate metabolism protein UlaG (beta-lactamase superfamily)